MGVYALGDEVVNVLGSLCVQMYAPCSSNLILNCFKQHCFPKL